MAVTEQAAWADGENDFDDAAFQDAMSAMPLQNNFQPVEPEPTPMRFDDDMVRELRAQMIRDRGPILDERLFAEALAEVEARFFAMELWSGPTSIN